LHLLLWNILQKFYPFFWVSLFLLSLLLLFSFKNLCVFWLAVHYHLCVFQILFARLWFVFYALNNVSHRAEFNLILVKSSFLIVSFIDCPFIVLSKKLFLYTKSSKCSPSSFWEFYTSCVLQLGMWSILITFSEHCKGSVSIPFFAHCLSILFQRYLVKTLLCALNYVWSFAKDHFILF
jgi:hypothetical protein